ncbi:M23 family metallopeptidase [Lacrimispora saccharolytica]|uniref:Peptidase M23 n=1 Tax=Lacrimispora saccharolytica (strain ATCC 35040 / DSM 2544 / NRCC 2533 / WM1) TaxID=610130 RepID=D9R6L9_LACSW|nr:M23 family metallopeptidase [Lacrimispora saccharolytica]ADL05429.1 Peptidase M23 [[Clostridium] saccharolyticum WM1]QRV20408.1 M23 family metallopeptidase [Lacrimispora saccharolytica]
MKEKISQLFKDKVFLVLLVLGLLTIVAAAGVITVQRGNGGGESPYLQVPDQSNMIVEESIPQETQVAVAGDSNATQNMEEEMQAADSNKATAEQETKEPAVKAGTDKNAAKSLVLDFNDASRMTWPIRGNVILDYSMESTIYFPTLDQYKCNPGLVIQGDVSTPVVAPANAKVQEIGSNEEIGSYVVLNMGNNYTAICGQLKEVQVVENEYVKEGQVLGYVAEPTKYYSVEGSNVFFELTYNDKAIDPLDHMQ